MAKKQKEQTLEQAVELTATPLVAEPAVSPAQDELSKLQEQILKLTSELAAEKAKKEAARKPRKMTPEMLEIAAKRAEFEKVEPAEEGTVLRRLQELPRLTQVDAFPKLVRMMKHNRVAQLLSDFVDMVVEDEEFGRSFDEVLIEATTRVSKEKAEKKVEENSAEAKLLELLAEEPEGEQAQTDEERDQALEEARIEALKNYPDQEMLDENDRANG